MDLQEYIARERREAVAEAMEEKKKKILDELKAITAELDAAKAELDAAKAECDAAKAECDAAKAERDAAKAELNQIRAEQCNFRKLILLLIDKKLINELKRAVDDEAYRESLYVEFGIKPAQD